MNQKIHTPFFVFLLFATVSFAQTSKKPVDYLNVPGPLSFNKGIYNLIWSSHPTDNYYKQEYLAKGENVEKFKRLVMLETLTGEAQIKSIVKDKTDELDKMKASNPMINYETFEKNGEIMLDFLISENSPDGKNVYIVERNVYRYKSATARSGQKCLLLFAVSERAYGDDINKFLLALKAHRMALLNYVGAFQLPEVTIAK